MQTSSSCYLRSYSNEDSEQECHNSRSASFSSLPSLPRVHNLTNSNQQSPISNTLSHCITTLTGHTSYIFSLTLAGKFLYTGSSDNEIRVWKRNPFSYEAGDENHANNVVAVGKSAVKSLAVLTNQLFSAHQDCKIRVWKIKTQEPPKNIKYEKIATLPKLIDRTVKLINPNNQVEFRRHKKCTWVHHVDTVSALVLSRDQSLLYSVSWDRTLKVWRTSDFKCLESISNAHDDAINAVTVSYDGDVYTGSADRKIKVWRKPSGYKKHTLASTLEKHTSGINALALSPDGLLLYSGACDRSILVWEKNSHDESIELLGALRGHTKAILCLATVDDLVCSGSADKTVRVWRGVQNNYSCLAVLEGHQGPVKCLIAAADAYCPHNNTSSSNYILYSGSLDCDIRVWQVLVSK
ncbi:protein JINGUBANG-like [Amaranthus tricolor]|uniref:protein JINGUBANG-like n=1 Tax=Amaranthus tricolor TaxID=29722 RepID=UPI00258560D9|nr:protein JINGUBANG-like [Amaranthus tricolor]